MKSNHFSQNWDQQEINNLQNQMRESNEAREKPLKRCETDKMKRIITERQQLKVDRVQSKAKRQALIEDFLDISRKKKKKDHDSQDQSSFMKNFKDKNEKMESNENNSGKEKIQSLLSKQDHPHKERQKQQAHHNQHDSSSPEEQESDSESFVQEIDQTLIYSSLPDNCPNHPNLYVQAYSQGKVKYNTFSRKRKHKIPIPPEAYYLLHRGVFVYMDNFIRYNWRNLIEINFSKCQIHDVCLQTFFRHAHVYPNVKFLELYSNPFITFNERMPQDFHKLERINFGKYSNSFAIISEYSNHLTPQSVEEVRKYKSSHPHITVICYLVA